MKTRVMTIKDYDQVYGLWIHTPGMGLNNLDDSREGIEKFLKRNPTSCFVAIDGSKVVGIIMAGHDGRRGYIYHMVVSLEYRRCGIGKKLLDLAMEALEKEGIHKAALVVFDRNELGNAFWENAGFTSRTDLVYRNKCIHEIVRMDI